MEERYKEIWECGNTLEDNYLLIIEHLQQELSKAKKENEILIKNAEHNDKVVDKVNWENMLLNGKIKKIEEYVKENKDYTHDFTPSSPYYSLLEIIKGGEDK